MAEILYRHIMFYAALRHGFGMHTPQGFHEFIGRGSC